MNAGTKRGIFEGIRVLDLSRIVAGPLATRLFADQGAEVIKIEEPEIGELGRRIPVMKDGESSYFSFLNYGKKSVCVDLRRTEGKDIVRRLAATCDVLVENLRPGVMERLGLGYEVLAAENPRLVMCSITGFGQESPYRDWPFQAPIGHAMSGLMSLAGWVNGQGPLSPGFYLADTNAGGYAYSAIVTALFDRFKTGRGQHIDLSMTDALFFLLGNPAESYSFQQGKMQTPENRARLITVPSAVVEGVDGMIFIGGGIDDLQWQRLTAVMGRPELGQHPEYALHAERQKRREEIVAMLQEWVFTFDSLAEVERLLNENGVMAARIRTLDEAVTDDHFAARGMVVPRPVGETGPALRTGTPFRFSDAKSEPAGPAPRLGADNRSVLSGILGMSDDSIAVLAKDGVILETPAS